MADEGIIVLGAGLAGMAAAQELERRGLRALVVEQDDRVGGHAGSRTADGFTFDFGPHVSFTKRDDVREELARAVGGRFRDFEAEILSRWGDHWMPHPAQCHLHGLPSALVEDCILDAAEAAGTSHAPPASYAEWCEQALGRTFAERFTHRYTRKYWTAEPSQLTVDWVGPRMHAPTLREVVRGALSAERQRLHYITRVRYPTDGGYGRYVTAAAHGQPVLLGAAVVALDLRAGLVELADGRRLHFEHLVSSLPLPEVVRMAKDAPPAVVAAAEALACTSVVLVNVTLADTEGLPDAHWFYSYDEDTLFARGNLPHLIAPANAPPGKASLQLEVYHSRYRPLTVQHVAERTLADLEAMGLVRDRSRVLSVREVRVPYANILFDHGRRAALAEVDAWLDGLGVARCGRYGEWAYLWSDDAIVSGRRAGHDVARRALPGVR